MWDFGGGCVGERKALPIYRKIWRTLIVLGVRPFVYLGSSLLGALHGDIVSSSAFTVLDCASSSVGSLHALFAQEAALA